MKACAHENLIVVGSNLESEALKACGDENLIVVDCVHLHALCGVHRHYPAVSTAKCVPVPVAVH